MAVVCKDEPSLAETLGSIGPPGVAGASEVIVVDASRGALDLVRRNHPWVRWVDFEPPPGAGITIAHQRNVAVATATGDVIVFTDAGCVPDKDWLERLVAPIADEGEAVTAGPARADGPNIYSTESNWESGEGQYVVAAATINLAFRREVFDAVGGFDESFGAGEDLDFTWRAVDAGYRIRWVPGAVVRHEWGTAARQLRRSFNYGKGWARLLAKHPKRLSFVVRADPVPILYPAYLLFLPLVVFWPSYLALLFVPLWRARRERRPWLVMADHLVLGAGVLAGLMALARSSRKLRDVGKPRYGGSRGV